MARSYFSNDSFDFLNKLANNNNREWFQDNKQRYEDSIREPALDFIADFSKDLASVSPHFLAIPKKMGGSLMRVHRDIRFSKNKVPYKTNIGIQFRHVLGKDVHAPAFYLHIEPDECFAGAGIWRPDNPTLGKIRQAILEKEKKWINITQDKKMNRSFRFVGESLVNAPRGFPKDHPQLIDLKRKDYLALSDLTEKTITSSRLMSQLLNKFELASPYMRFLCRSLEQNY